MSGWDFDLGSSGSKAEWTKFPEGITRIRVVDEEPFMRWIHYISAQKRSINCPGSKECLICEIRRKQKAAKEQQTYNMTRRFSINVINRENGKLEILEQGITFFQDLRDIMADLKSEGKSLIDVDLKIRRRGTSKDNTSYRIDIGDEYPLTDAEKELIKGKFNFEEFYKPHTKEQIQRIINGEDWNSVMYPNRNEESIEIA